MGAVVKAAGTKAGAAVQLIDQSSPEPMSFGAALKNWAAPGQGAYVVTSLDAEAKEDGTSPPYLTSRLLKGILQASATTRGDTLMMAAKRIGVSYNHLMLVIENRRASSEELRERIAAYCGISPDLIRPAPLRSTDPAESGMVKLEIRTSAGSPAVVFIPKNIRDDDVRAVMLAVARWASDTADERAAEQRLPQAATEDYNESSAE